MRFGQYKRREKPKRKHACPYWKGRGVTYQKLNRLKRSLTLPVVQNAKVLRVRLYLARPYLKGLTKSITVSAPKGEVKLCRAAKIAWQKERWNITPVADHIRRGPE